MEGLVPRFELDTPRVNSEAPIGLIKKTSTKKRKHQANETPKSPKSPKLRYGAVTDRVRVTVRGPCHATEDADVNLQRQRAGKVSCDSNGAITTIITTTSHSHPNSSLPSHISRAQWLWPCPLFGLNPGRGSRRPAQVGSNPIIFPRNSCTSASRRRVTWVMVSLMFAFLRVSVAPAGNESRSL